MPSWDIRATDRLVRQLRDIPPARQKEVGKAWVAVQSAWGRPHLHAGAGIRKLGAGLFECRAGLEMRLLFQPDAARRELVFFAAGSHDEIRKILKMRN